MTDRTFSLPEGVPPLTSLYLYIAGSCNLACRHCWITPTYQTGKNGGHFIKLEHVEKAVNEGLLLGLVSVKLTGGEPTLHPEFREIVDLIDRSGLDILIETNGTLVSPDLAYYLKERKVIFISVSLDGASAGTHEALRLVQGSYSQAVAGIQNLVEAGFQPQIICTLHRGNIAQMTELVALAEDLGCGSVKFNLLQKLGRGEKFDDEAGLEISEILRLHQFVKEDLSPNHKPRIYFDIPLAFRPIGELLDGKLGHCSILNILGVLAGGEVSLCGIGTSVPELVYGHLGRDDLASVWLSSPGLAELRKAIPFQLDGICGECLHRDVCLGSCVANNYHTSRDLSAPYTFCSQADTLGLFPFSRKKNQIILESSL